MLGRWAVTNRYRVVSLRYRCVSEPAYQVAWALRWVRHRGPCRAARRLALVADGVARLRPVDVHRAATWKRTSALSSPRWLALVADGRTSRPRSACWPFGRLAVWPFGVPVEVVTGQLLGIERQQLSLSGSTSGRLPSGGGESW